MGLLNEVSYVSCYIFRLRHSVKGGFFISKLNKQYLLQQDYLDDEVHLALNNIAMPYTIVKGSKTFT